MEPWTPLLSTLSGQRRSCMEFLLEALPLSDLDTYSPSLFLDFTDQALLARERFPWCAALGEDAFLHYVLFPRVHDEDLSPHRAQFLGALGPRVEGLPLGEAVLEVNRWCHEHASYQAQDNRTASPLTVWRAGSGRCGEESAFLVSALRAVGIAARQVYAPRWSHCDDNHAWVEALVDGVWRFLGACEPEPVLDRGWFNGAAGRTTCVQHKLFLPAQKPHFCEIFDDFCEKTGKIRWYCGTSRYTEERPLTLRATLDGAPVEAVFTIFVLNEAALWPIASPRAGADGTVTLPMGRGDLWVRAELDGRTAEGLCKKECGAFTLELGADRPPEGWTGFDFRAPADCGKTARPLTAEQKTARTAVLARGDALRTARLAGFYDGARAADCPRCADLLREARGNFDEIYAFLTRDENPWRERLLRALSKKDLRDAAADTLEDHLRGALPYAGAFPEEVFVNALLCPRVADEPLTAWRSVLAGTAEPETALVDQRFSLYWPPDSAARAGRCDKKSRAVLEAAWRRANGIPARLRPLDRAVEVWRDGAFVPLRREPEGEVVFTKAAGQAFSYRRNWSLSRRTAEGRNLFDLSGLAWTAGGGPAGDGGREAEEELRLSLPAGEYRVLTSARLPVGDQRAAMLDFTVEAGRTVTVPLRLREYALEDMLYQRPLPPVPAEDRAGRRVPDAVRAGGRPALLFWPEDGAEPTEHVLNELDGVRADLEALGVDAAFFLRGREALAQRTLAGLLERWPGARVYFDDWAYDVETVARFLGLDPDRPPIAVAADGGGSAVYADCGYRVGAAALLARVAGHLAARGGT